MKNRLKLQIVYLFPDLLLSLHSINKLDMWETGSHSKYEFLLWRQITWIWMTLTNQNTFQTGLLWRLNVLIQTNCLEMCLEHTMYKLMLNYKTTGDIKCVMFQNVQAKKFFSLSLKIILSLAIIKFFISFNSFPYTNPVSEFAW